MLFSSSILIQNVINLQARAFKPAVVFTQNFAYQKHTLYPLNREFKKARQVALTSLLCHRVLEIKTLNFLTGCKTIEGYLVSQGVHVQRWRLRSAIKRVDPIGRRLRSMNAIRRRVYNVRSPLALWHMDGNHKLIR